MELRTSKSKRVPSPGAYSHSAEIATYDRLFLLSGMTGNVPGLPDEPMIAGRAEQTTQTLKNILALVEDDLGTNISSIVKMEVLLKHPGEMYEKEEWDAFNDAYKAFFASRGRTELPVRTSSWVVALPAPGEGTLVEITATVAT